MNQFDRDFDKTFRTMARGAVAVWVFAALCSLALTIAVIWGIVQIVQAVA